jgi:hypothetical protein
MTDEGWRKPPPRRVLPDDEIVYIPPAPDTERSAPRKIPEAFNKLVQTPSEQMREVRDTLDAFGQTMTRRFELFHEELALLREVVTADHAPRIEHVERTMAQKVARGGGIVGIVLLAAPLLADALPKYRWLFDAIAGALQ